MPMTSPLSGTGKWQAAQKQARDEACRDREVALAVLRFDHDVTGEPRRLLVENEDRPSALIWGYLTSLPGMVV